MKICKGCKLEKPFEDFHKNKATEDGYRVKCKECTLGHKPYSKTRKIRETYYIEPIEKECGDCGLIKPIEKFGFTTREHKYRECYCKSCKAKRLYARREKRKQRDPEYKEKERLRRYKIDLKKKYNLDYADYQNLLKEQNYHCAICPKTDKLCVDHNHTTGKVRQLLCDSCNKAIGLFNENPELLKSAIAYLIKHSELQEAT